MKIDNITTNKFLNSIEDLINIPFLPTFIPFSIMFKGAKLMEKIIYEETISGLDKKKLLSYLISNRVLIESFTDDEIKNYYKYFKNIKRERTYKSFKDLIFNRK